MNLHLLWPWVKSSACAVLCTLLLCAQTNANALDLVGLSLEELMNVKVSLVSRKEEPLGQAPAAVAVISGEELERAGISTIPDALRMIPGMQVARIDANKWAIGTRGFNSRFANKLLVQIDGRSVYSPLFSGVYWEEQDLVIEDIERIEVTRGPGATLWGANAVDGVINIVSHSAENTQGTFFKVGGGLEENAFATLRYGGRLGPDTHYRVYGKFFDRSQFEELNGRPAHDAWHQAHTGFRADWVPPGRNKIMLQGALYGGRMDQRVHKFLLVPPWEDSFESEIETAGGHLLAYWTRAHGDDEQIALQAFSDWTRRREGLLVHQHTFDIDFQHNFALGQRQKLVWGAGFRSNGDEIGDNSLSFSIEPTSRRTYIYSAFVQDEIELVRNRLDLIAGSKFEHNDFTGIEIQPSARLRWAPSPEQTLWAAASRAVRTPARTDDDVKRIVGLLPPGISVLGLPALPADSPPLLIVLYGDRDFDSETVLALEAGYRRGIGQRWLADIALFRNNYKKLSDAALGAPISKQEPVPHAERPLNVINGIEGLTWGVEAAVDGRLRPWYRLRAAYTYLHMDLMSDNGTLIDQLRLDSTVPAHQLALYSSMNRGQIWEFDWSLRYVDALDGLDIDAHFDLDMRLARALGPYYQLAFVGRGLLDSGHTQFVSRFVIGQPIKIERTLFLTLSGRF